jgi:outer membrane lipoprotein-sorting protein
MTMPKPLLALAAGLVLLAPAAARADDKTDAVLAKARTALAKVKSLQADLESTANKGGLADTVRAAVSLVKPNLVRMQLSGAKGKVLQTLYADGTSVTVVRELQKQFMRPADVKPDAYLAEMVPPLAAFLDLDGFLKGHELKHAGAQTIAGQSYEVLEFSGQTDGGPSWTLKLYFDPAGLPVATEKQLTLGKQSATQLLWLRNLKVNPSLSAKEVTFDPGDGYKEAPVPMTTSRK